MGFGAIAAGIGGSLLGGIGAAIDAKAQREAIKAQADAQISMLEADSKATLQSLQADSEAQQQVIQSDSTARIKSLLYQAETETKNIEIANLLGSDALTRGLLDEWSFRREASQAQGAQRAGLASSGVDVNSGSAAYLQEEMIVQTDLDALAIRQNAEREKYGFDLEAYNSERNKGLALQEAQSTKDVADANIAGIQSVTAAKSKGIRETTAANKKAIKKAADKQAGGISPLRSGILSAVGSGTSFAGSYFAQKGW